ncbi:MAG: AGE family epimerase/isomerase [Devosia sp.]
MSSLAIDFADRFLPRSAVSAPTTLDALAEEAAAQLTGNILPYWLMHARNRARGGFWGEVRADTERRKSGPRGALLTSRILWTFSAAYGRDAEPAYLEMANAAYDDLMRNFRDAVHGGLFWSIGSGGETLAPHKQVYGQAFGIYGLSEYFRVTGEAAALDEAIALYRLVEAHARDRLRGGYCEALSQDWAAQEGPLPDGLKGGRTKSQDAMLHVMEAYSRLYSIWPDPGLRLDLVDLINDLIERVFDKQTAHLRMYFDEAWNARSNHFSSGHDIEFSWLLTEAAATIGDTILADRAKSVSLALAGATLPALDADGGLVFEASPGGIVDPGRQWWSSAEAVVGFLNAYELSADLRFRDAALKAWGFVSRFLIDRRRGEWFGEIDPDGHPKRASPKIGLWKCPYHNGRACMEIVDRVRRLGLAQAARVSR